MAVKDNQRRLAEEIEETAKMVKASSSFEEVDADHGRVEARLYGVYRDLSFIRASWYWQQLGALVVVESKRFDKKTQKETTERRFYITNIRRGHTPLIAKSIRSNWSVENGLHWVLDVVFDKDRSQKDSKMLQRTFHV